MAKQNPSVATVALRLVSKQNPSVATVALRAYFLAPRRSRGR